MEDKTFIQKNLKYIIVSILAAIAVGLIALYAIHDSPPDLDPKTKTKFC